MSEDGHQPPELVYLPCAEHVATPEAARPLPRITEDGHIVLLVYSSKEKLYHGWGEDQPWLALPVEAVAILRESKGIDHVALDVDVRFDDSGRTAN